MSDAWSFRRRARRTLRDTDRTIDLLVRAGAEPVGRRLRSVFEATAYLQRFRASPANMATLRAFLTEELLEPASALWTDGETIARAAEHLSSGRVAVLETFAPPLTTHGEEATEEPEADRDAATPSEKTWIGIRLVDEENKPIGGERYWIALPDGQIREGRLDPDGRAFFGDLDPGTCEIRWPDLDEDATWPEAARVRPPAPSPEDKPFVRKTWIEIELIGEDDRPIGGEPYLLRLPDGTSREGVLDKEGRARVEGIDPGACEVTFPRLDREAIERVSHPE